MPARAAGKEPLSRERLLDAALAVADADGLGAVTMRNVAQVLECEAMTLYHYVDDKAALLAGLTEAVVDEIARSSLGVRLATDAGDWRELVRQRCLAARRVMLRHPWAPALVATQAKVPPTIVPMFEALVATMVEAGCSYQLAHRAIHSLNSLMLGFTQELFEPTADEAGTSAAELEAMATAAPHLARLAEVVAHEAEGSLSSCDTQAEFEFTLALILDGLEAQRRAEATGGSTS